MNPSDQIQTLFINQSTFDSAPSERHRSASKWWKVTYENNHAWKDTDDDLGKQDNHSQDPQQTPQAVWGAISGLQDLVSGPLQGNNQMNFKTSDDPPWCI